MDVSKLQPEGDASKRRLRVEVSPACVRMRNWMDGQSCFCACGLPCFVEFSVEHSSVAVDTTPAVVSPFEVLSEIEEGIEVVVIIWPGFFHPTMLNGWLSQNLPSPGM